MLLLVTGGVIREDREIQEKPLQSMLEGLADMHDARQDCSGLTEQVYIVARRIWQQSRKTGCGGSKYTRSREFPRA